MSSANETQVAGTHYRSAIQHWDFVAARGLGYFEGQVTKYLTRWRKKNGVQDLQKARHFLAKLLELSGHYAKLLSWQKQLQATYNNVVVASSAPGQMPKPPAGLPYITVEQFLDANDITDSDDRYAITMVAGWGGNVDILKHAFQVVSAMVDRAEMEGEDEAKRLDARLVEIARRHVASRPELPYAPKAPEEVARWEPHTWVLEAMREASGR
jgi:hypothetical protein